MSGQSQYLSQKILDHILGGIIWTPPSTIYLALSTAMYDPTASGSNFAECTGGAYARLAVTNDTTTWPSASATLPSTKAALNTLTFAAPTSSWGIPASLYILDAATAGNVLYGTNITNAAALTPGGQPFTINAGTFVVTED